MNFADELIEIANEKMSRMIPEISAMPEMAPEGVKRDYKTGGALVFGQVVEFVNAALDYCPAVMFDYASFFGYGIDGLMALSMGTAYAKSHGLKVIMDGDFSGDLTKYAEEFFYADGTGEDRFIYADALTVSPYNSAEIIKEFARICDFEEKGGFVTLRRTSSADKTHFENIVTKDGEEQLFKAAADDSGAFGEKYVGDNGYSVLGMITYSEKSTFELRNINRWGLGLVRAEIDGLDDTFCYGMFFPEECEGEFVVIKCSDFYEYAGSADVKAVAAVMESCVKKIERHRLGI